MKESFIITISLLLCAMVVICSGVCIFVVTWDFMDEHPIEEYIWEQTFIIEPKNLTKSCSPDFSIGIPFRVPREDPSFWLNRTSFTPADVQREICDYGISTDDKYLNISHDRSEKITIFIDYSENLNYQFDYFRTEGGNRLTVLYYGYYEYVNFYYFCKDYINDVHYETTINTTIYKTGFNSLNATVEDLGC